MPKKNIPMPSDASILAFMPSNGDCVKYLTLSRALGLDTDSATTGGSRLYQAMCALAETGAVEMVPGKGWRRLGTEARWEEGVSRLAASLYRHVYGNLDEFEGATRADYIADAAVIARHYPHLLNAWERSIA